MLASLYKILLKGKMLRDSECKIDNPELEQIFSNEFFNERQHSNTQCVKVYFRVHNSTINVKKLEIHPYLCPTRPKNISCM